jgi:hypothetical protein
LDFSTTPESPLSIASGGRQAIVNLVYVLIKIPGWGKILSIIVGILWIASGNKIKETDG